MPRISVVIPTYNRANLISETLDSVLSQTVNDIEVIVVDDGSTDATPAVVSSYQRVRYLHQANAGQAAARNAGIRMAMGEYIAFVDDDDLWLPNKLAQQLDCLHAESAAWVYCDALVFDGTSGQPLHRFSQINTPHNGHVGAQLLIRDFIASPTPMVRRDVFDRVGLFDASPLLRRREDWEMWLRIAAHYPLSYIPEPLARYRSHEQTATRSEDIWTVYRSRTSVIDRAVAFAPELYTPSRCHAMASVCLFTGRQFALAGDAKSARAMFARAIEWQPRCYSAYPQWLITLIGPSLLKRTARLMLQARTSRYQQPDKQATR
jgi:glycosyltransferase involved in cell wall biosynthesis